MQLRKTLERPAFEAKCLYSLSCCLFVALGLNADEGMWTLEAFPSQQVSQRYAVDIDSTWLDHVRQATVRLNSGCTGSFASAAGLVLTNNHCVWRCIRNLSSDKRNLSESGFYAAKMSDEEVCAGEAISVLVGTENVTEAVLAAVSDKDAAAANRARSRVLGKLEDQCETKAGDSMACEAVNLYDGGQYFLYKYKRYDDVRLVFAPELAIAAFGGDPDNFNFPRYCLDMSFLRVYENGKPAPTPHYFAWRSAGPQEGEAVFVAGHPGSTQRLETVEELRFLRDVVLPYRLLTDSELRGRLIELGTEGGDSARLVQQRLLGLENGLKIRRHRLQALLDDERLAQKLAAEEKIRFAVRDTEELKAKYRGAWRLIHEAMTAHRSRYYEMQFLVRGDGFRGSLFQYARVLVRAAEERQKSDGERLEEYRDAALPRLERQLLAPVPVAKEVEQKLLSFSLDKMREWLGPDHDTVRALLSLESPDELAQRLVSGTQLDDVEVRRSLWQGGRAAIERSRDPMIRLALEVDPAVRQLEDWFEEAVEAKQRLGSEHIAAARFEILGTSVYPDATFSLRLSYGQIAGWAEGEEQIEPFTRLGDLYPRVNGDDPFRLPESWQQARDRLATDLLFNLVASTDIIGGNSGSPMLDAAGRLVGLVFDGNIHSIAGAYWFDAAKNRTVAVHPALMLAALRQVYEAQGLVDELSLVPATR